MAGKNAFSMDVNDAQLGCSASEGDTLPKNDVVSEARCVGNDSMTSPKCCVVSEAQPDGEGFQTSLKNNRLEAVSFIDV